MNLIREALIAYAVDHPVGKWKVRLILDYNGEFNIYGEPIADIMGTQTYHLAEGPVSSENRFLFHKTTYRTPYEVAFKNGAFDTLLTNERGELTEFTRGNVVLEISGARVTPPVSCGLLGGVYRRELIEAGEIHEGIVMLDSLVDADRVWFINSVRGWIEMVPHG